MRARNQELIAPCGLNCAYCQAHLRQHNPCPGCRFITSPEPISIARCRIKYCTHLSQNNARFCSDCDRFPCADLHRLDKRYRSRYHISVIQNLRDIQEKGIRRFVSTQDMHWTCPRCSEAVCLHTHRCQNCGQSIEFTL